VERTAGRRTRICNSTSWRSSKTARRRHRRTASRPGGGVPDRETVESAFATTADERDVTVEGTRVSVTGTWNVES